MLARRMADDKQMPCHPAFKYVKNSYTREFTESDSPRLTGVLAQLFR